VKHTINILLRKILPQPGYKSETCLPFRNGRLTNSRHVIIFIAINSLTLRKRTFWKANV